MRHSSFESRLCSRADERRTKHDPENPDRDRLIFSKGHSVLAQSAALAECGYFPVEVLPTTKQLGSFLQGHPERDRTPGIEANTGSLGQGLSIGPENAMAFPSSTRACTMPWPMQKWRLS